MKKLIKNAQVVLADEIAKTSVLIENGKIVDIDPAIQISVDEEINAEGLHLIPGCVDDQVHFRDPGLTHKEDLRTGSMACAKGGITTFLEMPNTIPNVITADLLEEKIKIGESKCVVNFGFYFGATPNNLKDIQNVEKNHGHRTPGTKIFIGSSTGNLLVDDQEALESIFAETTMPICAHCEDEATIAKNRERVEIKDVSDHSKIRDHAAAFICTKRATDLARAYHHRFHVLHVSTGKEIELFEDNDGILTAEVCPHHLYFSVDDYERLGTLIQMNPSVKFKEDNKQLWEALIANKIQVIATDHAPHTLEEKDVPYPKSPSGLPAVENSLALMLNEVNQGRLTMRQVVDRMCDAPARVWDIIGKGRIEVGYDADLVLVDMNKEAVIKNEEQVAKAKWSPWNGTKLVGWPVRTFVAGQDVFRDGQINTDIKGALATFDHSRGGYWASEISTKP